MSFLKNVFNSLTDKRELKEPKIYKEFNEKSNLIQNLTRLEESNDPNIDLKKVANDLKLFSIGQTGEKNVLFELQNSMLPFLVLHDVYLEFEDYQAQLDFVIITHKFIMVLEVKKLFGNINVTDKGEFQRIITKNNKVVKKEGMYSPINQVERQVAILEKLLKTTGNINKCPIKYAVTFANHKTILDISKHAPPHIGSSVIRHDQIKPFIKTELERKSPVFMLDQQLYDIADAILQHNKDKPFNIEHYTLNKPQTSQNNKRSDSSIMNHNNIETSNHLKTSLTEYRTRRSKELDSKPYYIFTNKILESIVEKKPTTFEQLLEIEGIGNKKVEEFGNDILSIIQSSITKDTPTKNRPIADSQINSFQSSLDNNISGQPPKVTLDELKLSLTEFRTKRSKELNVKPFYIFTNNTLETILEKRPRTKKELLEIDGIGYKKAEEFGQDILDILQDR